MESHVIYYASVRHPKECWISHRSQDDAFVRELRAALADQGHEGWIDSRELRGGDPLWQSSHQDQSVNRLRGVRCKSASTARWKQCRAESTGTN